MRSKPKVRLSGTEGNILGILARCVEALQKHGMHREADELANAVWAAESNEKALQLMRDAVEIE